MLDRLAQSDFEVADAIKAELNRQRGTIELIASENIVSPAVMEAMGTVLTNKYAEGYPGHRYYGGCEKVDIVENLAKERLCKLFDVQFANVQPHSGASANLAAYFAVIKPGDTIMGLSLDCGGHLTHGSQANFSGKIYNVVPYGLNPETELIDYDEMERLAKECRPAIIVGGASAYPRFIDFKRMREIADEVGAYLMIDIAHIAGLVARGLHPSPVPYAHIVTSTTHKTLRGPRGGVIMTNDEEIAKKINSAVFPGSQGGPLMHIIAAKAVAFGEALKPEFKTYMQNVVANNAAMGKAIIEGGLRLVTGGTDNHLCLVDLTAADVTGKDAEHLLEEVCMTVNKNCIPNEPRSPFVTSGIRVGSAAATTRGLDEKDFAEVGRAIAEATFNAQNPAKLAEIKGRMQSIIDAHPLYPDFK
ncbi:MAG: serine hydroxymethyltransferase [Eggerthellaceae bacterium]|nr:serine hydroxymethyltransferase [Eggerthellaceae bacterium]